jgi:hypothetical protein
MDGRVDTMLTHLYVIGLQKCGRQNISQLCQIQRLPGHLGFQQNTRPECYTLDHCLKFLPWTI